MPALFLFTFRFFRLLMSGHQAVALENAALRLQLAAFQRKRKRPVLTAVNRVFWVTLCRWWSGWRGPLAYVYMRIDWMAGVLVAVAAPGFAQDCSVYAIVENTIILPGGMFVGASGKAESMFRNIGVNVRILWDMPRHTPDDACRPPIVLQIEATAPTGTTSEVLGYAFPFRKSGVSIHLIKDRIVLGRTGTSATAVLAHVIVHEITHVLKGTDQHSSEGVMKTNWSWLDYKEMTDHPLCFSSQDVEQILVRLRSHAYQREAE
jgi:hypothetical protein